jgi:hypothetical protein
MLGSFIFLYFILTLYGSSLLYKDVEDNGCDPSASFPGSECCKNTGADAPTTTEYEVPSMTKHNIFIIELVSLGHKKKTSRCLSKKAG